MAQIGEYEEWSDDDLEGCINGGRMGSTGQDRFVAALELWHRSRKTTADQADQLSKQRAEIERLKGEVAQYCRSTTANRKRAETAEATVASMDSVEKSHRADCHGLSQRIEEFRQASEAFVIAWDDRRSIVGESRMDSAYIRAKRALKPREESGG